MHLVPFCFSWYMKAQQIAPKNGKPYNQLAVLALYTVCQLSLKLQVIFEQYFYVLLPLVAFENNLLLC